MKWMLVFVIVSSEGVEAVDVARTDTILQCFEKLEQVEKQYNQIEMEQDWKLYCMQTRW